MTSDALIFTSLYAKDDLTLDDWRRLAPPPRALERAVTWRIRYGRRGAAVAWVFFTLCLFALVYAYGLGDWKSGFRPPAPIETKAFNVITHRDEITVTIVTPMVSIYGITVPRPQLPLVAGISLAALLCGLWTLAVTVRNNRDLAFLTDGVLTEGTLIEAQPQGETTVYGRTISTCAFRFRYTTREGAELEHTRTGLEGAYPVRVPLLYRHGAPTVVRIPTPLTGLWVHPEFVIDANGQMRPAPDGSRAMLALPPVAAFAFVWAVVTILSNLVFAIIGG